MLQSHTVYIEEEVNKHSTNPNTSINKSWLCGSRVAVVGKKRAQRINDIHQCKSPESPSDSASLTLINQGLKMCRSFWTGFMWMFTQFLNRSKPPTPRDDTTLGASIAIQGFEHPEFEVSLLIMPGIPGGMYCMELDNSLIMINVGGVTIRDIIRLI
ncbi:hypothetical protein WA026_004758 [Henosepilachna vigintioctopunctata]|uniref:Uncharacterized protein n=1 Tax=Henosepilachna vigintioctopunctata TaxID=420089 RepID=A0AAW1V1A0_9CUCU